MESSSFKVVSKLIVRCNHYRSLYQSGFDQNATIKDDDAADENDDVNDEAGAAATAAEVDEELASEMVIIEPG